MFEAGRASSEGLKSEDIKTFFLQNYLPFLPTKRKTLAQKTKIGRKGKKKKTLVEEEIL